MITADLSGRTALVTGGASGIGLATVERLARAGARVALNHLEVDPRGPEQALRLRAEGLEVFAVAGSVAVPGEAEAMVREAIAELGRLDYLVNNAGTAATDRPIPPAELDRLDEGFWKTILDTNLLGAFRCAHAAAGALREAGGAVVNVASVAGLGRQGSSIAYGASKAALIELTRGLARALAPDVRVNAVAPGHVDSPWTAAWPQAWKEEAAQKALLKRRCTPDDIAEAIFYLLAGARMVTGQVLVVDGGLTLG
ncbi:MAG: SDR family oxidoreductase [Geminicoccaceae bacterium]|nr:SDR family oxidoreductase [Geminicoccaceae bacterium]